MDPFHRIRLHGPWTIRCVILADSQSFKHQTFSDSSPLEKGEKIRIPEDWISWCESHSLCSRQAWELTRGFGMPSGLTDGQPVWLVVHGDWAAADHLKVWLNNQLLNESEPGLNAIDSSFESKVRYPVRSQLLARNQLRMRVTVDDLRKSVPSPDLSIYLEIG